jgi:RNA polymerase sigma factor (sigma-70 family)
MTAELQPLLERLRMGDGDAVAPLLQSEARFIQAQVRRFFDPGLQSVIETTDLQQDVSLRILRKLSTADFTCAEAFRAWIVRVVRSVAIDAYRHFHRTGQRVRVVSFDDPATLALLLAPHGGGVAADDPSPSSMLRRDEVRQRLATVLEQLPPHRQEIIRLAMVENQRLVDIAARTGRKPATVRKELERALRACAKLLLEHGREARR